MIFIELINAEADQEIARIQNEIDEEERAFEPLPAGVIFEPDQRYVDFQAEVVTDSEIPDLGDYQDQPEMHESAKG